MGRSYIPKHVTRGGRETGPPCPFLKIGKKCPNLGKKCPDCGHLWVHFSFKVHFLRVYRSKNRRFFFVGPFFFILQMIVYRNALIPKKLSCSKKFLVTRLMPTHLFQNIQKAQPINKKMRTTAVVAVAAKINNKKVIYDGDFSRKQLTAKSR